MSLKLKIRKKIRNFLRYFKITPYVYYTYKYNDPFIIKKRLFKQNPITIFDVGANDGSSMEKYKKYFSNSSIYSFEPTPKSFSDLQVNASKFNNVEVFNVALTSFVGKTDFYINISSLTNSIFKPSEDYFNSPNSYTTKEKITVDTNTIDEFCIKKNIDKINILKIDVQGADLDVLKGASNMLKRKQIDLIYVEVEFVNLYINQPLFHDISLFLFSNNYHLYSLYNLSIVKDGQLIYGDAVFLPK